MTPPEPLEHAERAVLGALLLSPKVLDEVTGLIGAEDFWTGAHRTIFEAIIALNARGAPPDVVTVADELHRIGRLDDVGGSLVVTDILSEVPTSANAGYYAQIVADHALRRRLRDAAGEIAQLTQHNETPTSDLADASEAILRHAAGHSRQRAVPQLTADLVNADHADRGHPTAGINPTPAALSAATGPLAAGDLILIGGGSSTGKTILARQLATHTAVNLTDRGGATVLYVSPAEPAAHVAQQISHQARLIAASNEPPAVAITDTPGQSVASISATARGMTSLRLIIVDYLHLLTPAVADQPLVMQVTDLARRLKLLARELALPVVAISPLSRAPSKRADPTPRLGDLRGSGSLEDDADQVWLLHQPDVAPPTDSHADNGAVVCQMIVAKHRRAAAQTITLKRYPQHFA